MSEDERLSLAFIWDVTSPRFSRRSFMKTMAFASAAGFVAACGGGSGGGTKQSTAKVLNFYNWTDYVDPNHTIPDFEKQTGIKVTYDNYSSNDELLAKMQTGNTGYDLIVPTDSTLVRMKHAGLVEKIDLAKIPNVENLDPRFRNAEYDPGNEYSIPWQWGTTGIGYDKSKVGQTVDDWDGLKLPSVKGKSSFLDEARDAFAMALFAMGNDPNTIDDKQLDAARDYLIALKKNIKAITSDYQDPLKSGELIMAHAYSGDVFQIETDNPKVLYVIPKSGAFSWVDSMAVPKGASHVDNAHAFMNYILDPHVGAILTNFTQYGSPNKAALPFIDKALLNNPLVFPPKEVLAKLPFQKDLGEDEIKYSDRWTQVKSS
jgi:spermidine/putrescine transport system substrate-binding protein